MATNSTTSITIRDVPKETRDELAARAARSGRSLQEYVRGELIKLVEKPTAAELMDRVEERLRRTGTHVPAKRILELRDMDRE